MFWNCTRRPLGEDYAERWGHYDDDDAARRHRDGKVVRESCSNRLTGRGATTWKVLQRHGYRTMWCPGPAVGSSCTLSATQHCDLVDEADVVVSVLGQRHPACRQVARDLDAVAAQKPVVVVAPRSAVPRLTEELPACHVVAGPLSSKVVIRALTLARPPRVGSGVGAQ